MARTDVTPQNFDATDEKIDITEVTIDSDVVTAGIRVVGAFNCHPGTLRVRVKQTASGSKTLTLKAGEFAPAIQGDNAIAIAQNKIYEFKLDKDAARHQRFNGDLYIDLQTGFTGTITATFDSGYMG